MNLLLLIILNQKQFSHNMILVQLIQNYIQPQIFLQLPHSLYMLNNLLMLLDKILFLFNIFFQIKHLKQYQELMIDSFLLKYQMNQLHKFQLFMINNLEEMYQNIIYILQVKYNLNRNISNNIFIILPYNSTTQFDLITINIFILIILLLHLLQYQNLNHQDLIDNIYLHQYNPKYLFYNHYHDILDM